MKRCLRRISFLLLSGLILSAAGSCVSADGNNAEPTETKEDVITETVKSDMKDADAVIVDNNETASANEDGSASDETKLRRTPVTYSNALARELIEKLSENGTLTDEEFLQAVEMDEQGNIDVYDQMLAIVHSSNSRMDIIEEIGNKQQELKAKYKYLRQLHRMLLNASPDKIPASVSERVLRLNNDIKMKMLEVDSLSRQAKSVTVLSETNDTTSL